MNDVVAPVWNEIDFKAEAHRDPWSVPLDEIDVSNPYLYSEDTWHGFFARLRRDDPVHFCDSPLYGRYWSVTRYRDIMSVDTSHQTYSSDAAFGCITLKDVSLEYRKESFIAMDPPRHDEQRKIVAPIVHHRTWPRCLRRSVSGRSASWKACRAERCSTGSIASRSS